MTRTELSSLRDAEVVAVLERHYVGRHVEATALDLSRRVLDGAHLGGAVLAECAFDGASLRDVVLWDSHLGRCSFVGADMTSVSLVKTRLSDCDLRYTRLVRTNLIRAFCWRLDMRAADLSGADLTRCGIHQTDLRGAVLRDATLSKTSFGDCLVDGADFTGASGTLLPYPINVGTPEEPRILEGDEALAWLRAAGADVTWFVSEEPS